MPLYEYECTKCGKIEEIIQKFSDAPLYVCNHCSGKLSKIISSSAFHLKGSGWYVTDYGNGSVKNNSEKKTVTKKDGKTKTINNDVKAKNG